jgi:hypothetical protein
MSKPSRLPAVAGTLTGLLAAALGAWYLYPGHVGPQGAAPAVPAQASTSQPASAAPRAALSSAQATERLMALPELVELSARIEKLSGGKSHGGVLESGAAPRIVDGKPYYELTFVENTPERANRLITFLVSAGDGTILVEDDADDRLLTLEQWRNAHPEKPAAP